MVNKALFTSNKEDWETPQDFYDRLNAKYHFEWDLAASDDNAKCSCYFTRDENSLEYDWGGLSGNLFLNPPYGRELKLWVKKAATTELKDKQNLVMLIPSRTDTSYWHDYIFNHAEIEFLRGRLKFEIDGVSGDSAPFPLYARLSEWDNDIKFAQTFPEIISNVHENPELLEENK